MDNTLVARGGEVAINRNVEVIAAVMFAPRFSVWVCFVVAAGDVFCVDRLGRYEDVLLVCFGVLQGARLYYAMLPNAGYALCCWLQPLPVINLEVGADCETGSLLELDDGTVDDGI